MAATQNPLEAFIWGAGGSKKTPEEIARDKEIAAELLMKAGNTSPVEHWTQGAARVADALSGVIKQKRAERAGVENDTYNQGILSELFKGSSAQPAATPSASATIPASGASLEMAATSPDMQSYRDAIAGIESAGSGDYAAIGPTNEKLGRALGRYQIMEANIGPWSQAALGRAVTPDEFMADPKLQDTIFDHQFGQYVQKYGPEGAAQAWLGGEGGVGQVGRKDVLGTSIGEYGNRFTSALGGSPQAAIEAAAPTQGGSLTDEVAAFEQTPAYSAQFPGQEPTQQPATAAQQPTAVQQVAQALPAAGQAQQAVPGMSEALLRAISDPRATPQTRAVVQALMQQQAAQQAQAAEQQQWMARQQYEAQQQQNDPLRRQQMEMGQIELDRARNPQPGFRTLTSDEKKQLGLPANGAFQAGADGKISQIGGGGVTVNNEGSIPAGYQAIRDAEGRVMSIEPIAGSPAALAADQAKRTMDTQGGRKETATDVITQAASNARNLLKTGWMTTGTPGRLAANLSESDAAELRRQVGVLKSQATIETLSAMRQASPTGGAMGAVSDKEGDMLAAAAGAIDPNAGKADVEKALDNYERTLLRTIHGPKVGDAIFEQTRVDKPISEMTDEELEALANGD